MIVDSQIHLWEPETAAKPWSAEMRARAHLPEALTYQKVLPMMDEAGVDRAIIVPPSWTGDENSHAIAAATRYPNRFAVMGRIPIENPESKKLLPTWKIQNGMLGIRAAFNHERASWINDGTVDWFWPAAEAANIPIMLFAPDAPEAIGPIAQKHPGLRLIIDHMGLATRGPATKNIGLRIDTIVPLAKHPNISVKLSAVPGFSREPYPFKDMTLHLRQLFDAFGPRRCFWGTDLTHQRGEFPYRQYVTHFMDELDFLSSSDKTWIMGEGILKHLDWK